MRVLSAFSILAGCVVLAGCFGPQRPAPVSLYGAEAGAGSTGMHTVIGGETLYSISQRYNIVMRDIVVANNLNAPFALNSGQRLKLPPPQQYVARAGDTLYQVSRLFGVESTEVARLNRMNAPYVLRPGQVVKLPSVTARTSPYAVQEAVLVPRVPVAPVTSEILAAPSSPAAGLDPGRKPVPPGGMQTASAAQASPPAVPKGPVTTPTPPRASSQFLTPVRGRVLSGYGPKANGLHNDGMNIAAPKGTPIVAADNGVVVYAGDELKGSGNLVLIRHADRWMTAYAHMDQIKVARGATVRRGQTIGTVGTTGSVDEPQLHFEVRRGTEAINPKRYLDS